MSSSKVAMDVRIEAEEKIPVGVHGLVLERESVRQRVAKAQICRAILGLLPGLGISVVEPIRQEVVVAYREAVETVDVAELQNTPEIVARIEPQGRTHRPIVGTPLVVITCRDVFDESVRSVDLSGQANREPVLNDRLIQSDGRLTGLVVSKAAAQLVFPIVGRILRAHDHRTRQGISPALRGLRAAQYLHLLQVPCGKKGSVDPTEICDAQAIDAGADGRRGRTVRVDSALVDAANHETDAACAGRNSGGSLGNGSQAGIAAGLEFLTGDHDDAALRVLSRSRQQLAFDGDRRQPHWPAVRRIVRAVVGRCQRHRRGRDEAVDERRVRKEALQSRLWRQLTADPRGGQIARDRSIEEQLQIRRLGEGDQGRY